jgi:hypothetical protein
MDKGLFALIFVLAPAVLFSQTKTEKAHHADSSYVVMFNVSSLFYAPKDMNINKFLNKYGYAPPRNIPTGLRFELAGMPAGGRMIYCLNAGTIVSRQDISTADLSLGVFRRFFETNHIWLLGGLSLGGHFDRIVLNGKLPPALDSLSKQYNATLSLHRTGLVVEPAVKLFWYPLKTKRYQLGLFGGVYYDLDFNSHWRVGYYPHNGHSFKYLRKPTSVSTVREFGWVFSSGLSVCF